jgi:group II intron reverse transcriptase/maturase
MNGRGKSDGRVVPEKPANKGVGASAERVEERRSAKGKTIHQNRPRTQSRKKALEKAEERIRQAARRDKKQRFSSLWHHVYDVQRLTRAFYALRKDAAVGVDQVSWEQYQVNLEERIEELAQRLARGGYRPQPVRRAYIPKPDGRQRPLGIPALEDKIVQRATAEVLNCIYEEDFLGFSYGFRQGRSQHNALDAIAVAIQTKRTNWVLDADIRGYFDAIDHEWLIRFIRHRIADERVVRHVKKWLHAGVLEDGRVEQSESGTPQGGIISPLLANIYLHYVFDLWAHAWRKRHARGDVAIVRYADDFVVGFQDRNDAERFQRELVERFRQFGLELHADKTRLVEFGRYAAKRRRKRGQGKPETFSFLGFTHICGTDKRGWFRLERRTEAKRLRKKIREVKRRLRQRMHDSIRKVGQWLGRVIAGHYNYYGVPGNRDALWKFRSAVTAHWRHALNRRSQKANVTWERMSRLQRLFLPAPRIVHPYPDQRLDVTTRGRSPVR